MKSHLDAAALGLDREADLVTGPHNLLGIELNEYAAELARVTVWIGELQWRLTHGFDFKTNPVLEPLDHIECRDALIWTDEHGLASEARWPSAAVVIGNLPFLGGKKFVSELGESYAGALRSVFSGRVHGLADLISYWFEKARAQMMERRLELTGLVATNSIRDGFGRDVLSKVNIQTPIFEAWSDESWVNEGAEVRVSLVAFSPLLCSCTLNGLPVSHICSNLSPASLNFDITTAKVLIGMENVAFQGTTRSGPFDIPGHVAREWLPLPNPNGRSNAEVIRPWSNGLDITRRPTDSWIIDFGSRLSYQEASLYEKPFEHCWLYVRPTRMTNRNPRLVTQWWHYDGVRICMRQACAPLSRYIATAITAKFRTFVWFHPTKLADATLVVLARSDDTNFGILHSRFHEVWSLATCSWLGVGNDPRYTLGSTFQTFPFPHGLTPADTAHQTTETLPGGETIPAGLPGGSVSVNSASKPGVVKVFAAGTAIKNIANLAVTSSVQGVRTHAIAIAQAAYRLNALREAWLNPPEWTQRLPEVIPLGMASSPYPDRIVAKLGHDKDLAERTLTKLYNQRPAWLAATHHALDMAVAAAYGWADYSADMADDEQLKRLLALNLARAAQ